MMKTIDIVEEKNEIDDHFLDIIGNEFKWEHEKGISEWLKNSVDAYVREQVPDSEQVIILRLLDGEKDDARIEMVDFIGMTSKDIDGAFKRWGDPEAARRGLNKRMYGGHGNGGKYYMRQMFEQSYFVTYRNGYLNVFGFNARRKYGYAEKDSKVAPEKALKSAGIENIVPPEIKKDILSGKKGFTVVRGIGPSGMKNKIKFEKIVNKFKIHPQSRRILSRINCLVSHNDSRESILLKPEEIKPLKSFETPRVIEIPGMLKVLQDGEEQDIELANKKYPVGNLVLRTSEDAMIRGTKLGDLNRIDIVGEEIGVIGSYQLYELGVTTFPQASFVYGECVCPILEDAELNSVRNDRSKLVENARTYALTNWIREQVDSFAQEIAQKERSEQEAGQKKISAAYNDFLNKWKDRFMNKIMGDFFRPDSGGEGDGESDPDKVRKKILEVPENGLQFSYEYAEITLDELEKVTLKALVPKPIPLGGIIKLKSSSKEIELVEPSLTVKSEDVKVIPTGEKIAVLNPVVIGRKIGATGILEASIGKFVTEIRLTVIDGSKKGKSKKPKTPRILLSGRDPDPLGINPDGLVLTDREPAVYQRYQDVPEGIYWINTQAPLAKAILERYGDKDPRWRDYLFQRYVDIFVKLKIYDLQKRDPDGFRAETIDIELNQLIRNIHMAAMNDLGQFFFDHDFVPNSPEAK